MVIIEMGEASAGEDEEAEADICNVGFEEFEEVKADAGVDDNKLACDDEDCTDGVDDDRADDAPTTAAAEAAETGRADGGRVWPFEQLTEQNTASLLCDKL